MRGRLIVIEGSDGAGKTTQSELLKTYLKNHKLKTKSMSFPQYTNTFFGKMIAKFLRGEIAPLNEIHPYLISMVYAMDRAEARDKLYRWLNHGNFIVLNRYVTSNMAHQSGRLPRAQIKDFLHWLDELEYKVNNVPREDIVIYLHVPVQISLKLMENTDRSQRTYSKGAKKDIVESNLDYLRKAETSYERLAKKFSHWVKIECVDKNGKLRTREDIHKEIVKALRGEKIIPQ